jgi:hypothetical protein
LAYLLSAIGGPATVSALTAPSSSSVAACDGPANHTKSPVASINAARPLALIVIWQSPYANPDA